MKLLFVQGGSRLKKDTHGNWYTDSNFNNNIWKRYRSYCDELVVILRKEDKIYNEDISSRFNIVDTDLMTLVAVPDIMRPVKRFFDLRLRKKIDDIIKKEVLKCDKAIIRSATNFYSETVLKYCIKYRKPYLIEVTGFAFDGLWYHSLKGKIIAPYKEFYSKKHLRNADYALYVTNDALQKRYPCSGKSIGCSDVELDDINTQVLKKRLKKIDSISKKSKIIIGTAANLDLEFKGQLYIVGALSKLKQEGITNIKYSLIGAGSGQAIKDMAKKFGVEHQIEICGSLPHEEVWQWYDSLDIYVHPSKIEGLCRSIVEAMSRACPVIASDVGGNYELINKKWLFKKGKVNEIASLLKGMMNIDEMRQAAKENFETAKKYDRDLLDEKRDEFYTNFTKYN